MSDSEKPAKRGRQPGGPKLSIHANVSEEHGHDFFHYLSASRDRAKTLVSLALRGFTLMQIGGVRNERQRKETKDDDA